MLEHRCVYDIRDVINAVVYRKFVAVLEIGLKSGGFWGCHLGPVFCQLYVQNDIFQRCYSMELEVDRPGFLVQVSFNPSVSVKCTYGDYRFINVAGVIGQFEPVLLFHTTDTDDKKQCRDCQRKVFPHFVC